MRVACFLSIRSHSVVGCVRQRLWEKEPNDSIPFAMLGIMVFPPKAPISQCLVVNLSTGQRVQKEMNESNADDECTAS